MPLQSISEKAKCVIMSDASSILSSHKKYTRDFQIDS